ncbi:MAG: hypothetical protein K1X94_28755 [Sandaracinaceae bacterium]|nr:hypothetical protein [Sandaracinaceae bacterium]
MKKNTYGLAVILVTLLGCDGGGGTDAGRVVDAARMDARSTDDAASVDDAFVPTQDAPGLDAPSVDDAYSTDDAYAADDAYVTDDAPVVSDDAWIAPGVDGGVTDCVAGGGSCVAVVPGACGRGIVGNADWYSCGRGVGVLCCLPARTPPSCRNLGTPEAGWYQPDGTMICAAACGRSSLTCENAGTRSEGWYATPATAGCSGSATSGLVQWTDCAP